MKNKVRRFGKGGETDDSPDFSRLTFKEAFQAARGGPDVKTPDNKTFMWNGKKYSTGLASKKPAAKASGPDESAAETSRLIRAAATKPDARQGALEGVHPESILVGGPLVKAGTRALAGLRAAKEVKKAAERKEPSMGRTARMDAEDAAADSSRAPRNMEESSFADEGNPNFKRGGKVKKMASGGSAVSSASKRADGCAVRGKTKGRMY